MGVKIISKLIAYLLLLTLFCCMDSVTEKSNVFLNIFSELPTCRDTPSDECITTLKLQVRNVDTTSDILEKELTENLSKEEDTPFILRVDPELFSSYENLIIFAQGYNNDILKVNVYKVIEYTLSKRIDIEFFMTAHPNLMDQDQDGFIKCLDPVDDKCDCNDQNDLINPLMKEICGDHIDNNCSGFPSDEGCECTEDILCSNIIDNYVDLVGIGVCNFGVRKCLDSGFYAEECTYESGDGRPVINHRKELIEICDDNLDNNCNGSIDEDCACEQNAVMYCFQGQPYATQNNPNILGVCKAGIQECLNGFWTKCSQNEVRPEKQILYDAEGENIIRVDFLETQCDGIDENCDGNIDELHDFDTDNDGFTYCGTCPLEWNADPNVEGRLCAEAIDCDDTNPLVYPPNHEEEPYDFCGDNIDNDCRCDHGSNIGLPIKNLDGTLNCETEQTYLDCSIIGMRSDPTQGGNCGDQTEGLVYYLGEDTEGNCTYCNFEYGTRCIVSSEENLLGACESREDACSSNCSNDSITIQQKPMCATLEEGTCINNIPPIWINTPNTDLYEECPPVNCNEASEQGQGPYFIRGISYETSIAYENGICHYTQSLSNGSGHCSNISDNTSTDPSWRCLSYTEECNSGIIGEVVDQEYSRDSCETFETYKCYGTKGPQYKFVKQYCDPHKDCPQDEVCNGENKECQKKIGVPCTKNFQCASNLCFRNTCSRCGDGVLNQTFLDENRCDPRLVKTNTSEIEEECDDGNTDIEICPYGEIASCTICNDVCRNIQGTPRFCGDNKIDFPEEECDDGNTDIEICPYGEIASCTICNDVCKNIQGNPHFCGDNKIDSQEECDDGNTNIEICPYGEITSCTICNDVCKNIQGTPHFCGDNEIDSQEECDDGSSNSNNGLGTCNEECQLIDSYRKMSSNLDQTCVINIDNLLLCFGDNSYGQLGINDTSSKHSLELVDNSTEFNHISLGKHHTCVITIENTLWCFGDNTYGQFGDGTTNNSITPKQEFTASISWVHMSAGDFHTCAITTGKELFCFGKNDDGQLGSNTTNNANIPIQEATNSTHWTHVSAGKNHTCALTIENTLWCFGNNNDGQLGNNTFEPSLIPVQELTSSTKWVDISLGDSYTCAITTEGTLFCFGRNDDGQLGNNTTNKTDTPIQEATNSTDWTHISAGKNHTCALTTQNTLWCFGNNNYGQLGNGIFEPSLIPVQEATNSINFTQISTGDSHTCALTTYGTLLCFGKNIRYPLVDNETYTTPTWIE